MSVSYVRRNVFDCFSLVNWFWWKFFHCSTIHAWKAIGYLDMEQSYTFWEDNLLMCSLFAIQWETGALIVFWLLWTHSRIFIESSGYNRPHERLTWVKSVMAGPGLRNSAKWFMSFWAWTARDRGVFTLSSWSPRCITFVATKLMRSSRSLKRLTVD